MKIRELEFVGFKLSSNKKADFYAVCVLGKEDYPLMSNGKIILFLDPKLLKKIFKLAPKKVQKLESTINVNPTLFNIDKALNLIESKNIDHSATIVDVLNILIDFVKATKIKLPSNYKKQLYKFADHLTFEKRFGWFLKKEKIDRKVIIDGILWCIGKIISKSTFI